MKFLLILIFSLNILNINSQNTLLIDDGRVIKIPIILHLVKKGKRHNVPIIINKDRIQAELDSLNKNFSASNHMSKLDNYFIEKKLIGNPRIQFYLKEVLTYDRHKRGKKIKKITPDKALNIIVGKYKGSVTPCTLTEKCTPKYIQINYKNFGKGSQTVTHELGHWFGLYHVWGKIGKCKRISNPTDDISDTPIQYSCTKINRDNPCPPIDKKRKPNYNNFMDYSSCRCFFTVEQVKAIRSKIINFRTIIYENSKEN